MFTSKKEDKLNSFFIFFLSFLESNIISLDMNNKQKATKNIDFLVEFEDDADLFSLVGLSH